MHAPASKCVGRDRQVARNGKIKYYTNHNTIFIFISINAIIIKK